MRQPARPAAQAAQQIVMQAECRPEGGGQQELPGLQQQRLLHSAQQAREQAALSLRLLIGHCVHGPVDGDLPAVDRERLQMQLLPADDQNALCRVQHDGFLVEHEQLNDILLPFMNN